jgi:lysophospholipase L1-like esterase
LYTYLALGDSYTIGEGLPLYENFPYQAVQLLRGAGYAMAAPEIIARTGWTTAELQQGIDGTRLLPPYAIVTLLIGVNNQYRRYDIGAYATEFTALLQQAIAFAGGMPQRVVVLSIPDWGVTPFAAGRNPQPVSAEIDAFNHMNKRIVDQHGVHYLDITPGSRVAAYDRNLLAGDQLHYSAAAYAQWAALLAEKITGII